MNMRSHPRIAIPYSVGAAAASLIALQRIHLIATVASAWLAVMLAWMALAYWTRAFNPYFKCNGRISWVMRILLGPHVLGTWLARKWAFYRMDAPWHEIAPRVILGRVLTNFEALELLGRHDVGAVLDLTAEHGECRTLRQLRYRNVPVLDMSAPTADELRICTDFVADCIQSQTIYVHCGKGAARSAAVAAAHLLASENVQTVEAACGIVARQRPCVRWTAALRRSLHEFERSLATRR